jgi:hypothetical protein
LFLNHVNFLDPFICRKSSLSVVHPMSHMLNQRNIDLLSISLVDAPPHASRAVSVGA